MNLIDRSPGGVIIAANALLYGTVLAEIGMLTTASLFWMGAVMALIIVMAAALCRFIMHIMGDEEYIAGETPVAAPARVPVVATAATPVVAARRGAPAVARTPVLH
jgi:hypothetical protein